MIKTKILSKTKVVVLAGVLIISFVAFVAVGIVGASVCVDSSNVNLKLSNNYLCKLQEVNVESLSAKFKVYNITDSYIQIWLDEPLTSVYLEGAYKVDHTSRGDLYYLRRNTSLIFQNENLTKLYLLYRGVYSESAVVKAFIVDDVPPEITLNGENYLEIEQNSEYVELGATALDNLDGDITSKILISGVVDPAIFNTYKIVYSVSDNIGNKTEIVREIKIIPGKIVNVSCADFENSNHPFTYLYDNSKCETENLICSKESGLCAESNNVIIDKTIDPFAGYIMNIGDKIVYNNYKYELTTIESTFKAVGILKSVLPNGKIYTDKHADMSNSKYPYGSPWQWGITPEISEYGAVLQCKNVDWENQQMQVKINDNCFFSYINCINYAIDKKNCKSLCSYDQSNLNKIYKASADVAVSMPEGYSKFLDLVFSNAKVCYEKLNNLYTAENIKTIHVSYNETVNSGDCFYGDYSDNVLCFLYNKYSDESIASDKSMPKFLDGFQQKIDAGECIDLPMMGNLDHEMTHNYLFPVTSALQVHLSEGIATYTQKVLGHRNFDCQDEGYYNNGSTELIPYEPLNFVAYKTGACFVEDLVKKYGEDKLKELIAYSGTLEPVDYYQKGMSDTPDSELKGCYSLFEDIINPVVGEDAFPLFKDRYKMESDPVKCSYRFVEN